MGIPANYRFLREHETKKAGHLDYRQRAGHIIAIEEMIGRWPGRSQEVACGLPSERVPVRHFGTPELTTDELIALRQRLEPIAEKLRFIEYPTVGDVEKALA